MLWGGWLLVTGLVFSFMAGTYHDYYTVALAPAIAALVGVAGQVLWRHRTHGLARIGLAATMIITAVWAFVLLERADRAVPAPAVAGADHRGARGGRTAVVHRLPRAVAGVVLGLALLGGTTGPAAYALQTVATPHTGSIVTAGPVTRRRLRPGAGRNRTRPSGRRRAVGCSRSPQPGPRPARMVESSAPASPSC